MSHSDLYAQIDKYAYTNALARCSPVTKGFFAISALIISVSSPSIFGSILVLISATILLLAVAKIPAHLYRDMFFYPILFLSLSCLFIALFFGFGEPFAEIPLPWFTWTIFRSGISLSITTFLRVVGALSCLFFLVLTTSVTDIFITLRRFKIPRVLVEISLLVYRYIFVFLEISTKMNTAQKLRLGHQGFMKRIRSIALIGGNMFIRTLDQGERTFIAMNARGYDGNIHVLEELPRTTKSALAGILAFDVILIVIILFTLNIGVF